MIKMENLSDSGNASINSSGLSNGSVSSSSGSAGSSTSGEYTAEYLAQLLKDKKQLAAFPNVFSHLERLVDDEVQRVRVSLFHLQNEKMPLVLPEAQGPVIQLQEKLFVPVKDHPEYNFVGRILGPRGMTAKQLEQETGCKIMIRGKGSMRDKQKEEQNRGKPNWEHLTEELHVLLSVEDTENRAKLKLQRAMEDVNKLLVPAPEGEDDLKRKQLMELAIINGTYRPVVPDTKKQLQYLQYYPGSQCIPMMQALGQQQYYFPNGGGTPSAYFQPPPPTSSCSSLLSPTPAPSVPENPAAMAAAAAAAARLLPTAASLQFAAAALGNPLRHGGHAGVGGLMGNHQSMGPATLGAPIILSPTRLAPHAGAPGGGVPGSGMPPGHPHHQYANQHYPGAPGVVTSLAMSMSGQSPTGLSSITPAMAAGLFSGASAGGVNVSCGQTFGSADLQQMMASAGLMYSPLDPSLAAAYPYQAALTSGLTSPLLAGEYPGMDTHAGQLTTAKH